MKFAVQILEQAKKEIENLTKQEQNALNKDYEIIENKGLEFVKRRFLKDGLFEIKTNNIRSLFKYKENAIILVGLVYEKKSNKAPDYYIKLAKKRLKEI